MPHKWRVELWRERVGKYENRDEMVAAQFMLGPEAFVEWAWNERIKANPVMPRPSQAWPYRPAADVIELSSKRKK